MLKDRLGEHSAELTALEAQAANATPGQKYLLERKIENLRRDAGRDVSAKVAGEIDDALRSCSMETVREQPVNSGAPREQGRAILNASFLVAPKDAEAFDREIERVAEEQAPRLQIDVVGPLPPSAFATLERGAWDS